MVQDLSDLASLGSDYSNELAAVDVSPELLEHAALLADELGTLLAGATQERKLASACRVLRDQAYTHLRFAVDEIREHGQYVFWNNPVRKDGYYSAYTRRHNAARSTKRSEPVADNAEA